MSDYLSSDPELEADRVAHLYAETRDFLRYLAEEFDKQMTFADRELSQTQDLLKDAVDTLTNCFTNIHSRICVFRLSDPIYGQRGLESRKLQEQELEDLLNAAIRTLQFQDLTKQLIDHALHRLAGMHEVMRDIKTLTDNDISCQRDHIQMLAQHRASIDLHVANIDEHKTNPVSQGHMMTGDIELF